MASIPTVQELIGGYVIETFVAFVLYGIFIAQTYVYAMSCVKDPRYLKLCIICIVVLETLHTAVMAHIVYANTISGFGDLAVSGQILWSGAASVLFQTLLTVFVESSYIWRIYILDDAASGLCTTLYTLVLVSLSLSSLLDLMIASSFVYYLWKNKTGFRRRTSMTLSPLTYGSKFILMKDSLLFAGFYLITSKVYANALMGTLNARDILRQMSTPTSGSSHATDTMRFQSRDPTKPLRIDIFQEMSEIVRSETPAEGPCTSDFVHEKRDRSHGNYDSAKEYHLC
ncbi:hypothetical protein EUX98_g2449 [Antrodiella citrinella]|uniref:DUF6534 domain-containing protein n=1 Tax=Antrodiella citrinella TaxID=2447956 RepID=A0A4S4N1S5_9APHY|nr:hypothetical protein EUX98_g2449 [Antrodiella citrinella]